MVDRKSDDFCLEHFEWPQLAALVQKPRNTIPRLANPVSEWSQSAPLFVTVLSLICNTKIRRRFLKAWGRFDKSR